MPSAWLELRRNKHGRNYLLRWENKIPDPDNPGQWKIERGAEAVGPSKAEANQKKEEKLDELKNGAPPDNPLEMSLGRAIDRYLEDAATFKGAHTVKHFDRPALQLLAAFAGRQRLLKDFRGHDMTGRQVVRRRPGPQLVLDWKMWLLSHPHKKGVGYNANSTRIWMRCARTFLGYWGVHPNPFDQIEMPAAVPVGVLLTDEQVRQIPDMVPPDVARAFLFDLLTGLRRGELLTLRWEKISYMQRGDGLVAGLADVTGKTGARTVTLDPVAVHFLGPHQQGGPVFETMTKDRIKHYTAVLAKKFGLPRLRGHDFRHNWATRAARRLALHEWLARGGWRSIQSAKGYLHLFNGERDQGALDYGLSPTILPLSRPA